MNRSTRIAGLHDYTAYARCRSRGHRPRARATNSAPRWAARSPTARSDSGLSASYRRDGGWVDRVNADTGAIVTPEFQLAGNLRPARAVAYAPNASLTITRRSTSRSSTSTTRRFLEHVVECLRRIFRNGNRLNNTSSDPFILPAVKADWNLGSVRL